MPVVSNEAHPLPKHEHSLSCTAGTFICVQVLVQFLFFVQFIYLFNFLLFFLFFLRINVGFAVIYSAPSPTVKALDKGDHAFNTGTNSQMHLD